MVAYGQPSFNSNIAELGLTMTPIPEVAVRMLSTLPYNVPLCLLSDAPRGVQVVGPRCRKQLLSLPLASRTRLPGLTALAGRCENTTGKTETVPVSFSTAIWFSDGFDYSRPIGANSNQMRWLR